MVFPLTGIGSISFHYSSQKTITKYEHLWNRLEFKARRTLCSALQKNSNCILLQNHFLGFLGCMTLLPSLFLLHSAGRFVLCRELVTSILARHPEIYNPPFANLLQCRFLSASLLFIGVFCNYGYCGCIVYIYSGS